MNAKMSAVSEGSLRPADPERSIGLLRGVMSRWYGSINQRVGDFFGYVVLNEERELVSVCVNGVYRTEREYLSGRWPSTIKIPADRFIEFVTDVEISELENLPEFNGRNDLEISGTVTCIFYDCINRYRHSIGLNCILPREGDDEDEDEGDWR